jgi:hypothetical protein
MELEILTFTRSGNATRINSEGLIELVSTNVPRLNYPLIDGVVQGCPSLLLEPQRINLLPYSEDFSNAEWIKGSVLTPISGFVSPKGDLSASKYFCEKRRKKFFTNNVWR